MIKIIVLTGLAKTNASEAEWDKEVVPAGKKWTLQELRPYFSRQADTVEAYLYKATERIVAVNSQPENVLRLPIPIDTVIEAGFELRLTGITDGTSTGVIVGVVLDETAA